MEDKISAKEKILMVVIDLLMKNEDLSKVTNREIASMSGVNSALINYYYQSKENLINIAAGACMANIAETLFKDEEGSCPADRIKKMLRNFLDFCFKNIQLAEIAVSTELKQGSIYTSRMLISLFREQFGDEKSDLELKLLTFQLLHPMQMLFLNRNEYQAYLFCNLDGQEVWNSVIDKLVDNIFYN